MSGAAGEAVHHRALRAPSSASTAQHVVVAVAVVDLQRAVEPLGEVDVPAERLLLAGTALRRRCGSSRARSPRRRAPAAARRAARSRRRPRRDHRSAPAPAPRSGAARRRRAPRGAVGDADGEAGRREVAADLHDPVDADGRGLREHRSEVVDRDLVAVTADVEVGVVVDDGDRQRVGRHRGPAPARLRRHRAQAPAARASSSSTTDSSSLVKTGAGLLIGVPTTTGRDSQRGVAV